MENKVGDQLLVWSFLLFGLFGCCFFCCLGGVVFFLLFGRGACFFFAVWTGGVFFFLLFGRGACSFFCCLGGGVFFFLLFGPGACFFFAVWAGDGSSLTYPSAWLVFKRPNNKRDRTAKKKHGFWFGDNAPDDESQMENHIN